MIVVGFPGKDANSQLGGLIGFDSLLKDTLHHDIEAFGQCIVQAGYLENTKEMVQQVGRILWIAFDGCLQAAKRCLMDCLCFCEANVDDLKGFLKGWKHAVPSGLAALFRLKNLPFDFPVNKIITQRHGLAARGSLKESLKVLKPDHQQICDFCFRN